MVPKDISNVQLFVWIAWMTIASLIAAEQSVHIASFTKVASVLPHGMITMFLTFQLIGFKSCICGEK